MTEPKLGVDPAPPLPGGLFTRGWNRGQAPLRVVSLGFLLAGALAVSPAAAQTAATTPPGYPDCTTQPDEVTTQAAQGAFQAGNASFNEADYPRAIVYWEDAYRRDCTAHLMLKNLARAYELNDQYEHAILALQTFIARNPDSPEREALQRRIENLQQKLDERARAATPVPAAKPPEQAPQRNTAPAPRNVLDEEEQFPSDEDEPSSGRSAVPLVFAGVGVAAGVVGGALWYSALKDAQAADDECGGRKGCPSDVADRGNDAVSRQLQWTIVAGAGAALAVGGVIWYFAQPSGDSEAAKLTPLLGSDFAGVGYQGAF
jgi:hypothetical protein